MRLSEINNLQPSDVLIWRAPNAERAHTAQFIRLVSDPRPVGRILVRLDTGAERIVNIRHCQRPPSDPAGSPDAEHETTSTQY